MTVNLEEVPVELGCVCEAEVYGFFGYCYEPAAFYDPGADENKPMYFCSAHRPMNDDSPETGHPNS